MLVLCYHVSGYDYLFFYIEHIIAHSDTVNTNMNLFETIILMLLCIGEYYSVTSYLGNI